MSPDYVPEKLCRRCRSDYRVDGRCHRCGEPSEVEGMWQKLHMGLLRQHAEPDPWREFMTNTLARWVLDLP